MAYAAHQAAPACPLAPPHSLPTPTLLGPPSPAQHAVERAGLQHVVPAAAWLLRLPRQPGGGSVPGRHRRWSAGAAAGSAAGSGVAGASCRRGACSLERRNTSLPCRTQACCRTLHAPPPTRASWAVSSVTQLPLGSPTTGAWRWRRCRWAWGSRCPLPCSRPVGEGELGWACAAAGCHGGRTAAQHSELAARACQSEAPQHPHRHTPACSAPCHAAAAGGIQRRRGGSVWSGLHRLGSAHQAGRAWVGGWGTPEPSHSCRSPCPAPRRPARPPIRLAVQLGGQRLHLPDLRRSRAISAALHRLLL